MARPLSTPVSGQRLQYARQVGGCRAGGEVGNDALRGVEEVSHIETELIFEHVSCRELPAFL